MKKVKYFINCVKKIDYKNMICIAKKISNKEKKNWLLILIDMVYCGIRYGAGYYDYQEFEFYNLSNKERKTYLTRVKNNTLVRKYNSKEDFHFLDNKNEFNKLFKDYIKRDYVYLEKKEDYDAFVSKHPKFIGKQVDGEGGKGIKVYDNSSYDELIADNNLLLEELIIQHDKISELYDKSVNTLRLFTFYDGHNAYVINSVFKIGNGGVTDNFSSGSMYTFVDDEGCVITPAIDRDDNTFSVHPISGKNIVGFNVPFYKEACNMVVDACKFMPKIKYIGWDVAITNDGPVIIEGNSYPGVFQIKPSLMKNMGLIPKYRKYMDI